ncbi:hypothetical protein HGM15179_008485, partial [Zosterops borbonicus]
MEPGKEKDHPGGSSLQEGLEFGEDLPSSGQKSLQWHGEIFQPFEHLFKKPWSHRCERADPKTIPGHPQVFEERRALLGKWFDKWTDGQRRRILVDLLERCSLSQQKFCAKQLQARVPIEAVDFTTRLPRVLSLYIFSFLDPRSLCRCAQVSWHWKYLSELDQLWMLKCLRFGWFINFCPTPFEQGVWKRHYIEMVKELRVTRPKTPAKEEFIVIDVQPVKSDVPERKLSVAGQETTRGKKELPPWRSSDRNPTDTIRYNYLDNWDPIEQARQARRKGGGHTPDLSRQAAERKKRGARRGSTQLRKVKSLASVTLG